MLAQTELARSGEVPEPREEEDEAQEEAVPVVHRDDQLCVEQVHRLLVPTGIRGMREDRLPGYLRHLEQVYPLQVHECAADVDDASEYAKVDERSREGDSGFSDRLCGEFALEFALLRSL